MKHTSNFGIIFNAMGIGLMLSGHVIGLPLFVFGIFLFLQTPEKKERL